jgi:hypothetical protein
MINSPALGSAVKFIKSLSWNGKLLGSIWALFVVLVALGIHGSSTGVTAGWWSPEKPYSGYLFSLPPETEKGLSRIDANGLKKFLMSDAKGARWDELVIATPLSLSQFAHNPRFPVVNTNIGNGENMLLLYHAPVWHITTLARPATWGYFILGPQRGLAWYWWFRVFACFTVLYLLLEIVLQGNKALAAFGAFWFCASAYTVCWSLWPAYLTFFIALGVLATYHLLVSNNNRVQIICALLLGLSIPGFVMTLYPPWQVPLGYLFGLLFVGLFIRDKLYRAFKPVDKKRMIYLAAGLILAAALTFAFIRACLPDLKAGANTVYPGQRVSLGGDYSFGMLFKGMYNLSTIYSTPAPMRNESESSSFYYFFPAIFFAVCISKRVARNLGLIGWLLIAYIVFMLLFLLVGFPRSLAKLSLLSYIPSFRADITIGLASIILCVYLLGIIARTKEDDSNKLEASIPLRVAGFTTLFFIVQSLFLMKQADGFPLPSFALLISCLAGVISYCLLAGKVRAFCAITGLLVVSTTAFYNPLATNLDHIYDSELAKAITLINRQSSERPFWVCYGGVHPGVLVTTLGGRSLSGVHYPPQLDIWHALDPGRAYENIYNRYAELSFDYMPDDNLVSFNNPQDGEVRVVISPNNPLLKSMGARYVLLVGDAQKYVDSSKLRLAYQSSSNTFSIFEIPQG